MTTIKLTDENGKIIKTTGNPSSGGEGDVYNIEGKPNLVVKIYNEKKRSNKSAYKTLIKKIQAMCDICDDEIMGRAGWPQQIVYSNNQPVGFIMNKISYCNSLHELCDPIDKKEKFIDNNWKYSILVAYNLACAVNVLHKKGIVIGDVNESNFLIGNRTVAEQKGVNNFENNGIVYCIDCDSFQILTDEEDFLCTVAKSEYLPPELIKADLHTTIRTQNHDNFGLAVAIFQLLILGKHPYVGLGTPLNNVSESILKGYFVFGAKAKKKKILPPAPSDMFSLIYYSLNDEIHSLFERAFSIDTDIVRPSAEEWINALHRQMDELVQCQKNSHYYDETGDCIWCRIQEEYGYNPWEYKPRPTIALSQIPYNSSTQNKKYNTPAVKTTQVQNIQSGNGPNKPLFSSFATYSRLYKGTVTGKLYLYPDALHFESANYENEQISKTIYFDDIADIERKSWLSDIKIIYADNTYDQFNSAFLNALIRFLYITLMKNDYQIARTSSAFENMNRQYDNSQDPENEMEYFLDIPKWIEDWGWVKVFSKWCIEIEKRNFNVILDIIKGIFILVLRLVFIPLGISPCIESFVSTFYNLTWDFGLAIEITATVFLMLPNKLLLRKKTLLTFLGFVVLFTYIYSEDFKDSTPQNNTPQQTQKKEIKDVKSDYINEITGSIKELWDPPYSSFDTDVKMQIRIDSEGNLLSSEIIASSGIQDIDDYAENTLLKAVKSFKPFPSEIKKEFVDIIYVFDVKKAE